MKSLLSALFALGSLFAAVSPAFAQDWTLTSAPIAAWNSLALSVDGTKLAAAEGWFNHGQISGAIYTSANSGNTWKQTSAPTNYWSSVASSADASKLVATALGGGIFTSSDSGATWLQTTAPLTNWVSVASSADGATIVAVGGGVGLIYTSTNAGANWSAAIVPVSFRSPFDIWGRNWVAVAASADGSKLVALANFFNQGSSPPDSYLSVLYTSTNSGATWEISTRSLETWSAVAISADGSKLVTAVGEYLSGPVYTSSDFGITWNPTSAPIKDWRAVASSEDGNKLVALSWANDQISYISTNAGATWTADNALSNSYPTCVVSSANGNKLAAIVNGSIYNLWLSPTPEISVQPETQAILAGTNVTFSVVTRGNPPFGYQWEFNGSNLLGATNAILTITNVRPSEAGIYTMLVTNSLGSVLSSNALLTVLPALPTTLPATGISATGAAVLNGSVTPGPRETLAWFEWGTDANYGEIARVIDLSGTYSEVPLSAPLSALGEGTVYHFRVVAWNALGINYGDDQSFVEGLLPSVLTLPVTSVTTTSATINATVNPGGPDASVYFRWGTDTNYGQTTAMTGLGIGSVPLSCSNLVTGLTPATVYHYQVVASNLLGVAAGADLSFSTSFPASAVDANGTTWKAVGFYIVGSGPSALSNPPVYSGIQAANLIFGDPAPGEIYGISTLDNFVTHTAYLDGWGDAQFLHGLPYGPGLDENYSLGNTYDCGSLGCAYSSYVDDHSNISSTNFVWKTSTTNLVFTNLISTWTATSAPNQYWKTVASSADGTKLVAVVICNATECGQIYTSTNAGAAWTVSSVTIPLLTSVASSADGMKLVAAAVPLLYTSTNSGVSWSSTSAPSTNWQCVASSADGNKLVATAWNSGIFRSANSGLTWIPTTAPSNSWSAVSCSADGSKLAAVVYNGLIYTSADSGANWMPTTAPSTNWQSVASSADGCKLVAAAYGGPIYTSTNSGASWAETSAPNSPWASVASSADGVKLVAVGHYSQYAYSDSAIYTSINSGATWALASVRIVGPPTIKWSSVTSSADGTRLVAVVSGGGTYSSQTMPTPTLSLTSPGGNALLSWTIPSQDFTLQQNYDLTTTNWTDVPTPPVLNLTNLQNEVIVSRPGGNTFYRLKR